MRITPTIVADDSLGPLGDCAAYHEPVILPPNAQPFVDALRKMLVVRRAEERIADGVADGTIKCPCHLAIGQEAPAVGVAMHLRRSDRAFGAHRSHAHFLAMGGSVHGLFAEVLGRDTGVSRGMGGSMHLIARESGFYGSVPIVGATIPIAVGAGLAAKMDALGDIAVSFFGDGATEEGGFHESMNLARVLGAPVLFVCENNLFSSHLHIGLRQPFTSVRRYADAHGIPSATVDGNDVVTLAATVEAALLTMRTGGGPFLLECITYRWRGHVGHREDEDVGVARKKDHVLWKGRDPIRRLAEALEAQNFLSAEAFSTMNVQIQHEIAAAWARAAGDPFPAPTELLARVYAEPEVMR
jgi:TPP-dependent pyruvate/acetoin dehydrogenase alpha subunit